MGLAGIGDIDALLGAASDPSASARMGVLLALRRLKRPEVDRFLDDSEPRLVVEAARAIYDVPIAPALPRLARLAATATASEPLLRRVLNANARTGGPEHASTLAALAARIDVPVPIRVEALQALAAWAKPPGLDRVVGLWRPLPPRPAKDAVVALRAVLPDLLRDAPDAVALAALRAIGPLPLKEAGPLLSALVSDASRNPRPRAEAIRALDRLDDDGLAAAVRRALEDRAPALRVEARRLLAKLEPGEAIPILESVLEQGSVAERRGALETLGDMPGPAADRALSRWLDRLGTKDVPPEIALDLIEAAAQRKDPAIARQLRRIDEARPQDDPLSTYRETLVGGDAERGWKIFSDKDEVECIRCHKARETGGEVGPDLNGIGSRQDRRYLLESIVAPDRQIASQGGHPRPHPPDHARGEVRRGAQGRHRGAEAGRIGHAAGLDQASLQVRGPRPGRVPRDAEVSSHATATGSPWLSAPSAVERQTSPFSVAVGCPNAHRCCRTTRLLFRTRPTSRPQSRASAT
jgi:quinoprotein glucose dehydrogenase